MTTEYRIRIDRDACDGVFACLVRDERFIEAADGLATIDVAGDDSSGVAGDDGSQEPGRDGDSRELGDDSRRTVTFSDDRLADARQAARACPVDAIDVLTEGADE